MNRQFRLNGALGQPVAPGFQPSKHSTLKANTSSVALNKKLVHEALGVYFKRSNR